MEPTQILTAINAALTVYEKIKGLFKDLIGQLPEGSAKQEATKDLEHATEALQLARVELAKGFDFQLCKRHFPPGIKLDIREDPFPRWKCSTCGDITPKKSPETTQRQTVADYF